VYHGQTMVYAVYVVWSSSIPSLGSFLILTILTIVNPYEWIDDHSPMWAI
jgi:hypothetical protein